MGLSTTSRIGMAVLAALALCASAGASAFTSTAPSLQAVQMPVQQVYGTPGAFQSPGWDGRPGPSACGVPRWNPDVRYMPGQVVRRHGELWVARRISAREWNENSPPEWTPQYWAPAECRY